MVTELTKTKGGTVKTTGQLCFILVLILTFMPLILGWLGLRYFIAIIFMDLAMLVFTVRLLRSQNSFHLDLVFPRQLNHKGYVRRRHQNHSGKHRNDSGYWPNCPDEYLSPLDTL